MLHTQREPGWSRWGQPGFFMAALTCDRFLDTEIERRVDIGFPLFTRQFEQQLYLDAVRVEQMNAVRGGPLHAEMQFYAMRRQEIDLRQPGSAAGVFDGDMIEQLSIAGLPPGRLVQTDVMVVQLAVALATVETHRWRGARRRRAKGADVAKAQQIGPEIVRFVDVAHVEDQMVDAERHLG